VKGSREETLQQVVADQGTARPQHPQRLLQCLLPREYMVKHYEREDEVEGIVVKRKRTGISNANMQSVTHVDHMFVGLREHLRVQIGDGHVQARVANKQLCGHGATAGAYLQAAARGTNALQGPGQHEVARERPPRPTSADRPFEHRHFRHVPLLRLRRPKKRFGMIDRSVNGSVTGLETRDSRTVRWGTSRIPRASKTTMPRFHLTVAALAAGLVLLLAALARASCAAPLSVRKAIKEAPSVVGATVVDVTTGKRWATVEVEEVWKGPELPSQVEIRAGPKDPPGPVSAASSVDRTFDREERYLFVPYKGSGSVF
jgi:hypothetical protein